MTFVGDWIQTYTGRQFWPIAPRAEDIDIADIAHALSLQCRFGGHCLEHYSVAQHCLIVSEICDPAQALWGLLHDASEAYLIDLPRPLKGCGVLGAEYRRIERDLMMRICWRFGLSSEMPSSVYRADEIALATERRDLMSAGSASWGLNAEPSTEIRIQALSAKKAEEQFLRRFKFLYTQWEDTCPR